MEMPHMDALPGAYGHPISLGDLPVMGPVNTKVSQESNLVSSLQALAPTEIDKVFETYSSCSMDSNDMYSTSANCTGFPTEDEHCTVFIEHSSEATFEDYYVCTGEVLGVGMSGSVMRAIQRRTGRKVAVKTFNTRQMSKGQLKDLKNEIGGMSSVGHPNIVRLEAAHRSETHAHLIMEDLEGGDVFEHLHQWGRIGESQAALVIQQVLLAVEHMHARGVVHRDIKLENIVYESAMRDKVKLIDFGFSTPWQEGMPPMRRICGTTQYIAPEVLRESYTSRADIWCVGAAAYTMLTGQRLPRDRRGNVKSLKKSLRKCSKEAQEFIAALLENDPSVRPSASEALGLRWLHSAAGDDQSVSWSPTRPSARASASLFERSVTVEEQQRGTRSAPEASTPPRVSEEGSRLSVTRSLWRRLPTLGFGSTRVSSIMASMCGKSKSQARVRPHVQLDNALQVGPP